MAETLVELTQRVCGEFDREQAHVAATHGAEAAASWWNQQATAVAGVRRSAGKLKAIILVAALFGFFLVSVIIVVISLMT
jgi:hypothetical protein